jgi:hypothetical protein
MTPSLLNQIERGYLTVKQAPGAAVLGLPGAAQTSVTPDSAFILHAVPLAPAEICHVPAD